MTTDRTVLCLRIPQQPQRQDSLADQLHDLHILAVRVGCYDAADWLRNQMESHTAHDDEHVC